MAATNHSGEPGGSRSRSQHQNAPGSSHASSFESLHKIKGGKGKKSRASKARQQLASPLLLPRQRDQRPLQAPSRKGDNLMRLYSLPGAHRLPGKFAEASGNRLAYQDPSHDQVVYFDRPRSRVPNGRLRNSILNSSSNIMIVDDLDNPALPEPYDQLHPMVRRNPGMLCDPQISFAIHGRRSSCDCVLVELLDVCHRQACLPLICCKRCKISPSDLVVGLPGQGPWFGENPSCSFCYNYEAGSHTISVPQPWAISLRWPTKPFRPAFAYCEDSAETNALYSLFTPEDYREGAEGYMEAPDRWTSQAHAFYEEPRAGSELHHAVRGLYGIESYFRVGFPRHPCKTSHFRVFVSTTLVLNTPVLSEDTIPDRYAVDDFIRQINRPFYAMGKGVNLCAICLWRRDRTDGVLSPAFFARESFIQHYRAEHWNTSGASAIHSATQLGSRIYQTHLLYSLCLAHCPDSEDPRQNGLLDWSQIPDTGVSRILLSIITSRPVPAAEAPLAMAPGPSAQSRPAADLLAAAAADLLDGPDEEVGSVTTEIVYGIEDSEILYSGLDGEQTPGSDPLGEVLPLGDSDVTMEEPPPAAVPVKKGQSGSSKKKR